MNTFYTGRRAFTCSPASVLMEDDNTLNVNMPSNGKNTSMGLLSECVGNP